MSRATALATLAVIVAGAIVLRFFGIGFLLPHSIAMDSLVIHDEAVVIRHGGDPTLRRLAMGLYPHLIPRLVLLAPPPEPAEPPQTLEDHLAQAKAPWVRINAIVALLSVLAVPGTYLLARRFMERAWSLFAAALMATSFLFLWFSQQSRPHCVQASLALLAVLACLRLRRRPIASSYLLAGAAMALAIGALHNGLATLVPFAAAILLRERTGPRGRVAWSIASIALIAAAFRCFYPFVFQHGSGAGPESLGRFEVNDFRLSVFGNSVSLSGFNGAGFQVVLSSLASYDPLISAFALLGLAFLIAAISRRRAEPDREGREGREGRARRADLAVASAYAVPYLLAVGMYRDSGERFAIPLLPYLACLAAFGLRGIWHLGRPTGHLLPRFAAALVAAAFLAAQALAAGRLSWIRSQPDTATQAASWIRQHIEPGREKILVGLPLDLPLLQTSQALRANEPFLHAANHLWFGYQWDLPPDAPRPAERYDLLSLPLTPEARQIARNDPSAYLRSFKAEWIVLESGRHWIRADVARFRAALGQIGTRVARFIPDGEDRWQDTPIAHQTQQGHNLGPLRDGWFWRVLDARCTGYVIEIWRLRG